MTPDMQTRFSDTSPLPQANGMGAADAPLSPIECGREFGKPCGCDRCESLAEYMNERLKEIQDGE